MNLSTLKQRIRKGEIDTVITVFPDVFGRLVGKRFTGKFFAEQVAAHGTHGCNYLLTVNMEMAKRRQQLQAALRLAQRLEIGRASCRERV